MRRERRYLGFAILLALPMSQLGHLLAYTLQGLPADRGVHAYFPNLLAALAGGAGALLIGALLVVAFGRLLNPGWARAGRATPLLPLLAALLAGQLLIYLFQETVELSLAGLEPGTGLLGWALAGQVPIALLAALALRWLSQRVEPALRALVALRPAGLVPTPALVMATAIRPSPYFVPTALRLANALRGPPSLRSASTA